MAKEGNSEETECDGFLGTQNPNPTPQGLEDLLSLAKQFGFSEAEIVELKQIYSDEKGRKIK